MKALFTCIICALSIALSAQNNYQNFTFVYVDNSDIGSDGLSVKQSGTLETLIDKADEERKFVLYVSNRKSPLTGIDKTSAQKVFDKMLTQNTKFPDNIIEEKENIREIVYKEPFTVTNTIDAHFFVTDYYYQTLLKQDPGHLIGIFPRELKWMAGNAGTTVNIHLYLNEKVSDKSANRTKEKLSFRYHGFDNPPNFYIQ